MFYYTIQTIVVYLTLFGIMYYAARADYRANRFKYTVWAIIIYSVVFGLRYGVGTDCITYIEMYEKATHGFFLKNIEVGFNYLMELSARLSLPSWVFMGITSFIQLFAIFLYLKERKWLMPYVMFTFMIGGIFLSFANGVRQNMAFAIFICSLKFIEDRRILWHYALLALAYTFHKSALILVILYPLYNLIAGIDIKRKYQYIAFIVAIIIGEVGYIQQFVKMFDGLIISLGYKGYIKDQYADMLMREVTFGVGYYIHLLTYCISIAFCRLVKNESKVFAFIYNLFFLGMILNLAFIDSQLIGRMNYYFRGYNFIVFAITLYVLNKYKIRLWRNVLIACICLTFVAILYRMLANDSAFFFIWQALDHARYNLH